MIKIKRILCIVLTYCFIGAPAYGSAHEPLNADMIKENLEEDYGINVIIPENEEYDSYRECILVMDKGLKRFPKGMIKEITESYSNSGISTNATLSRTEKISNLFSEYVLNEETADIHINTLQNSLYYDTCVASEEGFVYEIGHFISDYLFKAYGYEKLKSEFDKLNAGFRYGTWGEGYDKVFVNKHSSMSFKDEITDLIWFAEVHPDILRNINDGAYSTLHKKVKFLADVIDSSFSSVSPESKLWQEALPQNPDAWAEAVIYEMKEASLIPEEFDGIYNSYITKEDFYVLVLNIVESKLGKENFIKSFGIVNQEDYVAIDPVKGEIYVDNDEGNLNVDSEICGEKEKRLHEAYQIGLIDEGWIPSSGEYITRLEIAKLLSYIGNELGMDISDYDVSDYGDISNVKDSEKPFIYFISSKGLLKGDGTSFKPYDYCTYQEVYLMLMRFYNML